MNLAIGQCLLKRRKLSFARSYSLKLDPLKCVMLRQRREVGHTRAEYFKFSQIRELRGYRHVSALAGNERDDPVPKELPS